MHSCQIRLLCTRTSASTSLYGGCCSWSLLLLLLVSAAAAVNGVSGERMEIVKSRQSSSSR